jgi:taurine dioxygenase
MGFQNRNASECLARSCADPALQAKGNGAKEVFDLRSVGREVGHLILPRSIRSSWVVGGESGQHFPGQRLLTAQYSSSIVLTIVLRVHPGPCDSGPGKEVAMSLEAIQIEPATPRIGAYVSGANIAAPLTNLEVDALHRALADHQVLFFRDQAFTLNSQKAFGRLFGPLHIHPNTPGPEGHPEILPIHADASSKRIAGEQWHSDVSCDERPPLGSILHLHTVPKSGGDTIFASMYAAYDALSPRMKAYLDGLTALHSGERSYRRTNRLLNIDDSGRTYPKANHPVVRTHPVTKRKALFVNRGFTYRINAIPEEESDAVLNYLYSHAERPDFQVRFQWKPNSVAFWDNRAVQHIALWDYFPEVRSGYRVTIEGDPPV